MVGSPGQVGEARSANRTRVHAIHFDVLTRMVRSADSRLGTGSRLRSRHLCIKREQRSIPPNAAHGRQFASLKRHPVEVLCHSTPSNGVRGPVAAAHGTLPPQRLLDRHAVSADLNFRIARSARKCADSGHRVGQVLPKSTVSLPCDSAESSDPFMRLVAASQRFTWSTSTSRLCPIRKPYIPSV
jgi:hypothetical protein